MTARGLAVVVAFTAVGATSCGDGADRGNRAATSAIANAGREPASAAPAASSAAPGRPAPTVAFLYTGGFDAKKRSIALPSGVTDPVWGLDKGTQSSGKGRIELSVWSDGRVTGTASGALGDLVIEGNAEAGAVTASLSPATGRGFRGVLAGRIDDRGLHGHLEATSSDANLAREAVVELRPSPLPPPRGAPPPRGDAVPR